MRALTTLQRFRATRRGDDLGPLTKGQCHYPAHQPGDPIDTRPGFSALLDRIVSNGVRTVVVEDASRFARTLMVQEAGIATLAGLGVRVLTSRGDDLTDSDDEMRVAMRQRVLTT